MVLLLLLLNTSSTTALVKVSCSRLRSKEKSRRAAFLSVWTLLCFCFPALCEVNEQTDRLRQAEGLSRQTGWGRLKDTGFSWTCRLPLRLSVSGVSSGKPAAIELGNASWPFSFHRNPISNSRSVLWNWCGCCSYFKVSFSYVCIELSILQLLTSTAHPPVPANNKIPLPTTAVLQEPKKQNKKQTIWQYHMQSYNMHKYKNKLLCHPPCLSPFLFCGSQLI